MRLLLGQITSLDGTLAAESLTVIRHLIQLDPEAHMGTVVRLAKNLDSATDPQARATIIWLVGEFSGTNGEDNIAADVLRILLKDFTNESEVAKRQIVLLAAKVYLHHINREAEKQVRSKPPLEKDGESTTPPGLTSSIDHPVAMLWDYVLLLARFDTSYDLRDRTRLYKTLLAVPQLASLMLLAPKPAPQAPSPSETRKGFMLGSSALVLAGGGGVHGLRGYEPLPDWVREGHEPDPKLRAQDGTGKEYGAEGRRAVPAIETLGDAGAMGTDNGLSGAGAGAAAGLGAMTLDEFLAEDEDEDESEEEEEEEESEEDEEDEDEDGRDDEESENDDDEDEDTEHEEDDEKAELEGFLDS
jgi:hypothetical protein